MLHLTQKPCFYKEETSITKKCLDLGCPEPDFRLYSNCIGHWSREDSHKSKVCELKLLFNIILEYFLRTRGEWFAHEWTLRDIYLCGSDYAELTVDTSMNNTAVFLYLW